MSWIWLSNSGAASACAKSLTQRCSFLRSSLGLARNSRRGSARSCSRPATAFVAARCSIVGTWTLKPPQVHTATPTDRVFLERQYGERQIDVTPRFDVSQEEDVLFACKRFRIPDARLQSDGLRGRKNGRFGTARKQDRGIDVCRIPWLGGQTDSDAADNYSRLATDLKQSLDGDHCAGERLQHLGQFLHGMRS